MRTQKECEKLIKKYVSCLPPKSKSYSKEEKKKFKKFKKKHGFFQIEAWDFDIRAAVYMLPRICYIRDNHNGYPTCLLPTSCIKVTEEIDNQCDRKWTYVLNYIVNALYYVILDDKDIIYLDIVSYKREVARRSDIISMGLNLLGKYFTNIWD